MGWYADRSGDGRYAAFPSEDGALVPGDTNEVLDIFVHDQEGVPPPTATPMTTHTPAGDTVRLPLTLRR